MFIRLVGGPYHNRFFDDGISRLDDGRQLTAPCTYHLVGFYTCYGTKYWQFVHESLVKRGKVSRQTYRERLAKWELPVRELNDRLREALWTVDMTKLGS